MKTFSFLGDGSLLYSVLSGVENRPRIKLAELLWTLKFITNCKLKSYYPIPNNPFVMKLIRIGPATIIIITGRMQKISGISIFIGAFIAVLSPR